MTFIPTCPRETGSEVELGFGSIAHRHILSQRSGDSLVQFITGTSIASRGGDVLR